MGAVFVYWAGWPEPSLPDHPMTSFPQKSGDISRTMPGLAPEVLEDDFVRRKEYGSAPQPVASEKEDRPKKNSFMLDLNDGTLEEFKHLPGIGAILAGRIIAHRASHGASGHVDDLVLVPGIGKKRLEQLRSFVGVRASDKG